jgi:hypothetical protein
MRDWLVPLNDILAKLEPVGEHKRLFYPIRHGTMRVGVYAP